MIPSTELAAEIADDPVGRGYAGKNHGELLTLLNEPSRSGTYASGVWGDTGAFAPVPSRTLLTWAAGSGRSQKIKDGAANHADDAIKSICQTADRMLDREDTELNLRDAAFRSMIDALVVGGVLDHDDVDALVALAVPVGRSFELWAGTASINDLVKAGL